MRSRLFFASFVFMLNLSTYASKPTPRDAVIEILGSCGYKADGLPVLPNEQIISSGDLKQESETPCLFITGTSAKSLLSILRDVTKKQPSGAFISLKNDDGRQEDFSGDWLVKDGKLIGVIVVTVSGSWGGPIIIECHPDKDKLMCLSGVTDFNGNLFLSPGLPDSPSLRDEKTWNVCREAGETGSMIEAE